LLGVEAMTDEIMKELEDLFSRNLSAVEKFMEFLKPKIESAQDEHQRLYWHHIYEEEEQRLDRLKDLLSRVRHFLNSSDNAMQDNISFMHLLQDVSLEKFGLHNFEEHLTLAIFDAKNSEHESFLKNMLEMAESDYSKIKALLSALNETFDGKINKAGSTPTDEKENAEDHVKLHKFFANKHITKKLTVGSLKNL